MGESDQTSFLAAVIVAYLITSFGAVVEEFEVHDALTNLFATKDSVPMASAFGQRQQIAAY